jgi:hypothetical protein
MKNLACLVGVTDKRKWTVFEKQNGTVFADFNVKFVYFYNRCIEIRMKINRGCVWGMFV